MKSKYKNPDKFIEKLKAEVDWLKLTLEESERENNGLRGQRIVLWENYETTQEAYGDCLAKLSIGDTIMVRGKVIELSFRDGNSKMVYLTKETLKVEV